MNDTNPIAVSKPVPFTSYQFAIRYPTEIRFATVLGDTSGGARRIVEALHPKATKIVLFP